MEESLCLNYNQGIGNTTWATKWDKRWTKKGRLKEVRNSCHKEHDADHVKDTVEAIQVDATWIRKMQYK